MAGYDVVVKHLADPPTNDLRNFLGYCEAWGVSIMHHHHTEVSQKEGWGGAFTSVPPRTAHNCVVVVVVLGGSRLPVPQH